MRTESAVKNRLQNAKNALVILKSKDDGSLETKKAIAFNEGLVFAYEEVLNIRS